MNQSVYAGCDSLANVPLLLLVSYSQQYHQLVAHRLPHQTPKPVLTVHPHCYGVLWRVPGRCSTSKSNCFSARAHLINL